MTTEILNKIKEYAELNNTHDASCSDIYFEHNAMAITNPWIDESARFPLTDVQAVETYGLANVINFCEQVVVKALTNE